MRISRLVVLGLPLGGLLVATLANCVGDNALPAGGTDSGATDATQPQADGTTPPGTDSGGGTDGGAPQTDAGTEAGPVCNVPDSGTHGTIDPSFANTIATFGIGAVGIGVDPVAGYIYVAGGGTCGGVAAGVLLRFKNDGNIDTTWGGAGGAKPGEMCFKPGASYTGASLISVVVSPDGSVYAVGEVTDNTSADFGLIVGVDKAGLPLLSGSPMAITAISGQLYSLKLDSTGHLIIVGSNKGVGGTGGYIGLGTQGYVLRYSKQGTGTVGFGTTGVITDTTVTGYYDVVIGPGDSIYAVGGDSAQKVVVRAIASNGSAVGTFGSSGVVRADAGPYASGREAVMANSELVLGLVDFTMTSYGPLLVGAMPLNGNGLAASYADAGLAQPPLSTYDRYYNFHTIAAQCDGRVLVGGRADLSDGGQRVALTRYLTSGSADTTFGSGGTVYVDDGTGLVIPIGIAQDPISGKIILLGQNGTTGQFLLRLEP